MDASFRKKPRTFSLGDAAESIEDLSETGAKVLLPKAIADKGVVLVKLISGDVNSDVRLSVVHSVDQGDGNVMSGVSFMPKDGEQKELIAEMVERYGRGVPLKFEVIS